MKREIGCLLLGVAALATFGVSPCSAQPKSPASLEINAGFGFGGSSAPHGSSRGLSVNALLGFRPGARQRVAGGLVVAAGGSVNALGVAEACDVVPGGHCTPEFPEFWMLSALAGWETAHGRARVLAGPAVVNASSHVVGAAQARLDLAQPIFRHVSLLASGQVDFIPAYLGDSFRLGSVGVGFRLR